jgi:hypothetical protein
VDEARKNFFWGSGYPTGGGFDDLMTPVLEDFNFVPSVLIVKSDSN